MPAITFKPRVKETSTSTGTGNITLAGAVVGYQSFDDAFAVTTDYFHYCIEAVDADGIPTGQWEEGIGHLSASTTMVRDTLLNSSTGSAVSFSAGTKYVFCTVAARDFERLHSNVAQIYRALLTQSGTSAPADDVKENTTTEIVNGSWQYLTTGRYRLDLCAGDFRDKYFITPPAIHVANRISHCDYELFWDEENDPFPTYLVLYTYKDEAGAYTEANGYLASHPIEILVYP